MHGINCDATVTMDVSISYIHHYDPFYSYASSLEQCENTLLEWFGLILKSVNLVSPQESTCDDTQRSKF